MLTICASYDGLPVSVLLDSSAPQSLMSSQFALSSNIPRSVSMDGGVAHLWARGPLRVSSPSGWFVSSFPLLIAYVRDHDIVLGRDWLLGTGAHVEGSCICDPVDGAFLFAEGHQWERSPFVRAGAFLF